MKTGYLARNYPECITPTILAISLLYGTRVNDSCFAVRPIVASTATIIRRGHFTAGWPFHAWHASIVALYKTRVSRFDESIV